MANRGQHQVIFVVRIISYSFHSEKCSNSELQKSTKEEDFQGYASSTSVAKN